MKLLPRPTKRGLFIGLWSVVPVESLSRSRLEDGPAIYVLFVHFHTVYIVAPYEWNAYTLLSINKVFVF